LGVVGRFPRGGNDLVAEQHAGAAEHDEDRQRHPQLPRFGGSRIADRVNEHPGAEDGEADRDSEQEPRLHGIRATTFDHSSVD
jgi:hypothetical protein